MRKLIGLCIAALVSTGAPAAPTDEIKAPDVFADQYRAISNGRPVQASVAQEDIRTTIDVGRIAPNNGGGGLVGMLLVEGMDNRRGKMSLAAQERADAAAEPLRKALRDLNVDSLALGATKAALAKSDWFHPLDVVGTKFANRADLYARNPGPQFTFVDYSYELSPDFGQIRVIAMVTIEQKTAPAGKGPVVPQIIYQQRMTSIAQLRTPSYEPGENVARWAADGGRLGKLGMTTAFAQFEQMIPYALALRRADIDAFGAKNHEKAFAAGFYGPLVLRTGNGSDGVMIWRNGLLYVQSVQ